MTHHGINEEEATFFVWFEKQSTRPRSKTVKILNIILIRMYWEKNMVENKYWNPSNLVKS